MRKFYWSGQFSSKTEQFMEMDKDNEEEDHAHKSLSLGVKWDV